MVSTATPDSLDNSPILIIWIRMKLRCTLAQTLYSLQGLKGLDLYLFNFNSNKILNK